MGGKTAVGCSFCAAIFSPCCSLLPFVCEKTMALSIVTKTHKSDSRVAAADDDIEGESSFLFLVLARATETVYKIKKRVEVFTIKGARVLETQSRRKREKIFKTSWSKTTNRFSQYLTNFISFLFGSLIIIIEPIVKNYKFFIAFFWHSHGKKGEGNSFKIIRRCKKLSNNQTMAAKFLNFIGSSPAFFSFILSHFSDLLA